MSGVFETGVPLFTGSGDPDTLEVYLYHSIIDPSFSEKTMKMFESPVSADGDRTFKNKGRHATFTVTVNLHKFDSSPGTGIYASSKAYAANLLRYENKNVYFYPFYNISNPLGVKDSGGTLVPCHLTDIKFGFLERAGSLHDVCTITFVTTKFYDLSKLVKT